jgi:hypothetical protein
MPASVFVIFRMTQNRYCDAGSLPAKQTGSIQTCSVQTGNMQTGNMLLIGINYDEKEKTHTCAIERVEKTV